MSSSQQSRLTYNAWDGHSCMLLGRHRSSPRFFSVLFLNLRLASICFSSFGSVHVVRSTCICLLIRVMEPHHSTSLRYQQLHQLQPYHGAQMPANARCGIWNFFWRVSQVEAVCTFVKPYHKNPSGTVASRKISKRAHKSTCSSVQIICQNQTCESVKRRGCVEKENSSTQSQAQGFGHGRLPKRL